MKDITSQLSLREKRLLYILLCFLIVIGGWFLAVVPSLESNRAINENYATLLDQKFFNEQQLKKYLEAPDLLKQKKESYTEIIEKYNKNMSNEKIDKLLTTAFLSQGLRPTSLSITGVQPAKLTGDAKDKKTVTSSSLTQATVAVSVKGSFKKITNTIAYINKMKGIEVSSLSYSEGTGNDNPAMSASNDTTTLTIIVYMVNE